MGYKIKLCTANVNGLRDRQKRLKFFDYFKLMECDIVFVQEAHITTTKEAKLWEKEWGGKAFWGFGTTRSCGVGILIKKDMNMQIEKFLLDNNGRFIILDCIINSVQIKMVNVYCPNNPKRRMEFIDQIQFYLHGNQNIIMGGDFNCVEFDKDKIGNIEFGNEGKKQIQDIKDNFHIKESFRTLYPNHRVFSWQNETKNIKSRIDRIYMSKQFNDGLIEAGYNIWNLSDHAIHSLTFMLKESDRKGTGYWKCNVKLLNNDEVKTEISKLFVEAQNMFDTDCHQWWEFCKVKIKDIIIRQSRIYNKLQIKQFKKLQEKLSLYKDMDIVIPGEFKVEIDNINQEITDILTHKAEGAKIRSKILNLEKNEKPNKFFLQTEKKNKVRHDIQKLVNDKGDIHTNNEDILELCKEFYQNLYKAENIDDSLVKYFLEDIPKLNEMDKNICEGLITYDECISAIKEMKDGKSPGIDGLPAEFYKIYFPLFGNSYVKMINTSFKDGLLSLTQRHGIITLICKNVEKSEYINNWRPISLLNVDYKIISKVLSKRLKLVLDKIISIDQTCSVPGRSIIDNNHLIRNIREYVEQKNIGCAFISLDQSKAFDRVSHEYLFKVLEAFGFGQQFIQWVKLLYSQIYSSIIVNGFFSEKFKIERSVRQGCSLSPMLYVLCIEPFAQKIRLDKYIKGLQLPGSLIECKISQYADDTNCIVTSKESIRKIFVLSELYSLASGAKLNKEKSTGVWLGAWKNSTESICEIKWLQGKNIYGIHTGHTYSDIINCNKLLEKMKTCLTLQKQRSLSFFGKACIANVLACSKLWYVSSVQVIHDVYLTKFTKLLFDFIWNGKTEWVKRETLFLSPQEGGLGLINISAKFKALQVKHLINLMYGSYTKWHSFAIYWIGLSLRVYQPKFNNNSMPHSEFAPLFYRSCLGNLRDIMKEYSLKLDNVSTKKLYDLFCESYVQKPRIMMIFNHVKFGWNDICNNIYTPELKSLNWRILHHIIPCNSELVKRNMSSSSKCPNCTAIETVTHVFYSCLKVKEFWKLIVPFIEITLNTRVSQVTIDEVVFHNFKSNRSMYMLFISEAKYVIWNVRNLVHKEKKIVSVDEMYKYFISRVKMRIRADFVRMNEQMFRKIWVNGKNILVERKELVILF